MLGATTATNTASASTPLPTSLTDSMQPFSREPSSSSFPATTTTNSFATMDPFACATAFIPEACLFCNHTSPSSTSNHLHMQNHHGLTVPRNKQLIVDLETLFRYLHLVIHEYHECIYCHTQRISSQAVQQHMMDKRHCRFDIHEEGSEFREFYDFTAIKLEEKGDEKEEEELDSDLGFQNELSRSQSIQARESRSDGFEAYCTTDDTVTLQLPSGKIVSRRSAATSCPSRTKLRRGTPPPKPTTSSIQATSYLRTSETASPSPLMTPMAHTPGEVSDTTTLSSLLTRKEKRYQAFAAQLASLRKTDSQALAHLPVTQQQVLLATWQRQAQKSERAGKRFMGKMDGLGNQKVMERFVNDVPGGRSHRCRFLLK